MHRKPYCIGKILLMLVTILQRDGQCVLQISLVKMEHYEAMGNVGYIQYIGSRYRLCLTRISSDSPILVIL